MGVQLVLVRTAPLRRQPLPRAPWRTIWRNIVRRAPSVGFRRTLYVATFPPPMGKVVPSIYGNNILDNSGRVS
jgi:hypothetical protein